MSQSDCFICGESMEGTTVREIAVLGTLKAKACAPCVDLPDTDEFVNALVTGRLMPSGRMTPSGKSCCTTFRATGVEQALGRDG